MTKRTTVAGAIALAMSAGGVLVAGQQGVAQLPTPYPLSNSVRERGSSVTGAFEGWFYNRDGSVSLLVGYFNRNTKQELDIPVGPNNRIEPGGPDMGQPTHFLTSRQYGVFSIKVPKDFGAKELTWTLVANGQTNAITLHTRADWIVQPFEDPANKNTPPSLRFAQGGAAYSGPPAAEPAATLVTAPNAPLALTVWATDEGPKINVEPPRTRPRSSSGAAFPTPPALAVAWSLFRGPAAVKFDPVKPQIDKEGAGKATTTATFGTPGEYRLRVQANDATGDGGGGFQCCWTNAYVDVSVRAASTTSR